MNLDGNPQPITISDAAAYFGLPRSTVACWAHRGWTDTEGNKHTVDPLDHKGLNNAARYQLPELQAAEFHTRHNRRRSHRRNPRWQQLRMAMS